MFKLLVVLNDCSDGVMVPVEGKGVVSDIIVRKPLDKVQPKHWWHTTHKKSKSLVEWKHEAWAGPFVTFSCSYPNGNAQMC